MSATGTTWALPVVNATGGPTGSENILSEKIYHIGRKKSRLREPTFLPQGIIIYFIMVSVSSISKFGMASALAGFG